MTVEATTQMLASIVSSHFKGAYRDVTVWLWEDAGS